MRIARALSLLGRASRREAEQLIAQGRVRVNGQRVETPATLVNLAHDELAVDGKVLAARSHFRYVALHKPRGVVSTVSDPHADRTVVQLVPATSRLYPVGRLDKDSEGLILLTDDGAFANFVTHPRYRTEKEYLALVREFPSQSAVRRLRNGIMLDDGPAAPAHVEVDRQVPEGVWIRLVLQEGRNREVRRMLEAVGHTIVRLIRTRIGPVQLGQLRPGQFRELRDDEVHVLIRGAAGRARRRAARMSPEPGLEDDSAGIGEGADGTPELNQIVEGQTPPRRSHPRGGRRAPAAS